MKQSVRQVPGGPPGRPSRSAGVGRWGLLVGILAAGLVVLILAGWGLGALVRHAEPGMDRSALRYLVAHRSPGLNPAIKVVTYLGSSWVLIAAIVAVGVALWVGGRRWRPTMLLALSYLGSVALYNAVKTLTGRPRPPASLAIGSFDGFSFPSGHVTQAVGVWGMAALLVTLAGTGPGRRVGVRVGTWVGAGLIIVVVGFTRAYLGAHWLTDVLGGLLLGSAWVTLIALVIRRLGVDLVVDLAPDPPPTRRAPDRR